MARPKRESVFQPTPAPTTPTPAPTTPNVTKISQQTLSPSFGTTTWLPSGAIETIERTTTPKPSTIHWSGQRIIGDQTDEFQYSSSGDIQYAFSKEHNMWLPVIKSDVKVETMQGGSFAFLPPSPQVPADSTYTQTEYDRMVSQYGKEKADQLATQTYITTEEFSQLFPQQTESKKPTPVFSTPTPAPTTPTPAPTTPTPTYTPVSKVSSSVISILPFAIVGIVLVGILLFLRRRA
jgi:hypothetical protein